MCSYYLSLSPFRVQTLCIKKWRKEEVHVHWCSSILKQLFDFFFRTPALKLFSGLSQIITLGRQWSKAIPDLSTLYICGGFSIKWFSSRVYFSISKYFFMCSSLRQSIQTFAVALPLWRLCLFVKLWCYPPDYTLSQSKRPSSQILHAAMTFTCWQLLPLPTFEA